MLNNNRPTNSCPSWTHYPDSEPTRLLFLLNDLHLHHKTMWLESSLYFNYWNDFIFNIWLWHGDLYHGLPHIYFLFTVRLRIFHVCCNENFRNSYFSFYWNLSNIKSFLPVEAVISVTKVWTDGRTNGRTDGQGDCNIAPTLWVGL
jgi:hypothetical protein